MKIKKLIVSLFFSANVIAAPHFITSEPATDSHYDINGPALCATAKQTLAYLNQGKSYDPDVIHQGHVLPIPIAQIKATLRFICENQAKLNDPVFLKRHFDFIRWLPDMEQVSVLSANKPLLKQLPKDHILMTKYYVHRAKAATKPNAKTAYALYAIPSDEQDLTLEEANLKPDLTRFKYGKQAILGGALKDKAVPVLAYVSREDLESALLQGTLVADFDGQKGLKIFNVHRNNNIAYNKILPPYQQERYWYFKQVDGIKGYGKDALHKITVNEGVTFAANLTQFGLGKLLLVQYSEKSGKNVSKAGIFADTGGAFTDNLYQIDFLAGSYFGKKAYYEANHHLPDYVNAYFMVLKNKYLCGT